MEKTLVKSSTSETLIEMEVSLTRAEACEHTRAIDNSCLEKYTASSFGRCNSCREKKKSNFCSGYSVCLLCGYQGCHLEPNKNHAFLHYEKNKSHFLSFDLSLGKVWCYACNFSFGSERFPILKSFLGKALTYYRKYMAEKLNLSLPPKIRTPVGLQNMGYTCYMNAVLQCLFSLNFFREEVLKMNEQKMSLSIAPRNKNMDILQVNILLPNGALSLSLSRLFTDMLSSSGGAITPTDLCHSMKRTMCSFLENSMHDSHEYFLCLLDSVSFELTKRIVQVIREMHQDMDEQQISEYKLSTADCLLEGLFRGEMFSEIICSECHNKLAVTEPFLDCSLPILCNKSPNSKNSSKNWHNKNRNNSRTTNNATNSRIAKPNRQNGHKSTVLELNNATPKTDEAKNKSKDNTPYLETNGQDVRSDSLLPGGVCVSQNYEKRASVSVRDGHMKSLSMGSGLTNSRPSFSNATKNSSHHLTEIITCDSTPNGPPPDSSSDGFISATKPASDTKLSLASRIRQLGRLICRPFDFNSSNVSCDSSAQPIESPQQKDITPNNSLAAESANYILVGPASTNTASNGEKSTLKEDLLVDKNRNPVRVCSCDVYRSLSKSPTAEASTSRHCDHISAEDTDATLDAEKCLATAHLNDETNMESVGILMENMCLNSSTVSSRTRRRARALLRPASLQDFGTISAFDEKVTLRSNPNSSTCHKDDCEESKLTLSPSYKKKFQDAPQFSLYNSLNKFFATETLDNNNKILCLYCSQQNKVKTYTKATKCLDILRLPKHLAIHLKRFRDTGKKFMKVTEHVQFPVELDLLDYCHTKDERPAKYSLCGVIEHSGDLQQGHYIAYVKDTTISYASGEPPQWYIANDHLVKSIAVESVLKANAYLLFYDLIPSNGQT